MDGATFLSTAFAIAQELFPSRMDTKPLSFSDGELERIIEELEARTGYVRKAEYRQ
jgi:hypothetical protein